jgi:hypothetical protein
MYHGLERKRRVRVEPQSEIFLTLTTQFYDVFLVEKNPITMCQVLEFEFIHRCLQGRSYEQAAVNLS